MFRQPYPYPQTVGPQDAHLIHEITKAINGEYSAIACYEKLAKNAPNQKQRERIQEIRQDEIRHYRTFTAIYTNLTGTQPSPQISEQCPNDYRRGLRFAVEDEQKTVDFYNEMADKASDPYIRQQFTRAAKDEQNHAVWFLYFLTS